MSFGRAFWYEETVPSSAEAWRRYNALIEQADGGPVPSSRVKEFLADLHRRLPDLTEDAADLSPWAVPVSSSPGAVIVSMP